MTEFTPEQIAALVNGGNAKHNGLYLAGYDPARDMPEPSSHDASKLRDWLHRKYAQKQWLRDPNAPAPEPSHSAPRGQDGPRIGSGPRSQARRNSASGGGGNGSSEVRGPSSGRWTRPSTRWPTRCSPCTPPTTPDTQRLTTS